MHWKRQTNNSACVVLPMIGVALVTAMPGCAHTINPFVDEAVPPHEMTAASEGTVRAAHATPVVRQRKWKPSTTSYPSGKVVHWPSWFEDPFEDKGSDDGQFAWTAEDYLAMPYSFARLLLNTMGWPVSAIVTLPGTPMVSDGRLSRQVLGKDHDAIPLSRSEDRTTADDATETGQLAGEAEQIDQDDLPVGPPFVEEASFND